MGKQAKQDDGHDMAALMGASHQDDTEEMEYLDRDTIEAPSQTMPPETKEEAEAIRLQEEEYARMAKENEEDAADNDQDDEGAGDSEAAAEDDTASEEAAGEESEADADDKPQGIPHKRFEEVNQKRKDAEAKLEKLEAELATLRKEPEPEPEPEPEFDFDTKEDEYMDAVLEGEKEKAKELRAEIRAAEMAAAERKAQDLAQNTTTQSREQQIFLEATQALEAEFPMLSESNEAFDQDLVNDIIALHSGYMQSGSMNPVASINKATRTLMAARGIASESGEEPDNRPTSKDTEKKLAAAKKQPAKMGKSTENPDRETEVNAETLSEEEWESLPESVKRRMRGDYLT